MGEREEDRRSLLLPPFETRRTLLSKRFENEIQTDPLANQSS